MINDKSDCAFLLAWSGEQGGIPLPQYPLLTATLCQNSPGACGTPILLDLIEKVEQMIDPVLDRAF